jgi:hypothetical protein
VVKALPGMSKKPNSAVKMSNGTNATTAVLRNVAPHRLSLACKCALRVVGAKKDTCETTTIDVFYQNSVKKRQAFR